MLKMEFYLNLLKLGFSFMTVCIIVLGALINSIENHLPTFLSQTFRHGKFAYRGKPSNLVIEVPKSWFRHFYVFASVYSLYATILAFGIYFWSWEPPTWLLFLLDFLASSARKPQVNAVSAFLALLLLTLQAWRRFYETWFISVFSNCRMNWSHYAIGYIHYFGSVMAILAESPGFTSEREPSAIFNLKDVTILNFYGCAIFMWAFYHQYKAAVILANLRKDKTGKVKTLEHRVPRGDWFELVSAPHNLAEIMIYAALAIILWGSHTWNFVFIWVVSNQVENALLSHWWYKSKFDNYPVSRRAVIPYVL